MATTMVEGLEQVFKPYVLEIATSGSEEDGSSLCLALVVIRKPSGLLLAIPAGFFSEEVLEDGQSAGPMELIGPSHYVAVPGGRLEEMDGSPPSVGTESLDVLLVDMGTGVLEHLVPVADYSGPTEILHLFLEGDPFMYPLKDQLIAEAWEWILSPEAESRVQYYSAGEEATEEVPEVGAGVGLTSNGPVTPGSGMPSAKSKAKSTPNPRQKRPTTATLASSLEAVVAALPTLTNQIAQLNSRTRAMEEQMAQPGRLSALRQPIGSSAMVGSGAALVKSPAELFKEMPPPPNYQNYETSGAWCNTGGVGSLGDAGREGGGCSPVRGCKSNACPIHGHHCTGCTACKYEWRPDAGAGRFFKWFLQQRCEWEDEAATGVSFPSGSLLFSSYGKHEQENESVSFLNSYPTTAGCPRGDDDKVCGEIWRLWKGQRLWPGDVADCIDHGLPPDRKLAGSEGCNSTAGGVHGTNIARRCDGCGSAFVVGGGPTIIGLHKPLPGSFVTGEKLRTTSGSTMDYSCPVVHKRARCHQSETGRSCGWKGKPFNRGANPQSQAKATAKALEEKEERPGGWPRRGCITDAPKEEPEMISSSHHLTQPHGEGTCQGDRGYSDPVDVPGAHGGSRRSNYKASRCGYRKKRKGGNVPFSAFGGTKKAEEEDETCPRSITFQNLVASMPRWVLSTKTRFAYFVSRSFHIKCQGAALSTAVFPLPLADFNLAGGRGLRLSRRRWKCLARKRLLHLIIMALNFLHDGMSIRSLDMLGRRPNQIQRAIHKRRGSLIAACDTPGSFAINPGRSGNELVARLKWLEDFAKTCPLVSFGSYGGGPEDLDESGPKKVDGVAAQQSAQLEYVEGDLAPYHPLDAGRLKLTGSGGWDLAKHLHDELWLPFVEPAILRHGYVDENVEGPDFRLENRDENLKLAKLWSAQGLLCLSETPPYGDNYSRVFNNLKNEKVDRQIGDRRLMNAAELPIRGPSKQLPGGYLMTSLHCPPGYSLRGIVTDRKDFYHQAGVTRSRAKTNCLPFAYDCREFEGTAALREMREAIAGHGKSREVIGDCYGGAKRRPLLVEPAVAYPCFSSLFQGDHCGVEFALSAHAALLEDAGLLGKRSRILGHAHFPAGPLHEGLVIDDYYAISRQRVGDRRPPEVVKCLEVAREAYGREDVLGSPEKDVINSQHFRVVGAEINCSEEVRSRGLATVSAPTSKRLSMSVLSLKAAALLVVSRGMMSRLVGSWMSIIMYSRCLSSTMSLVFQYGVQGGKPEDELLHLPRAVAQELVLLSIFSFVAASDISVPYSRRIFATDASMRKGAVVSREVPHDVAKAVWLGGDKKGAYTKLENPFASALKNLGFESEEVVDSEDKSGAPSAGLDLSFDFCEICGGSGVVSKEAARLGMTVCPPIELSNSEHYDISNTRLIEWLCFMITSGKIRSCMFEPPCTSFSPAAHPAVRSYSQPLGFDRMFWKTWLGNLLAFRCFILMLVAWHAGRPSLFEQPFLSKMAWLTIWSYMKKIGFLETSIASCAFGSPHLKRFRLLHYKLNPEMLSVACPRNHRHIRIEGKLTKPSAVYVPALAKRFAEAFHLALSIQKDEETADVRGPKVESLVLNDILAGGEWRTDLQWFWRVPSHINILESHSYLSLLRLLAQEGGDMRFSALLDSQVAKCSHAKGRSSSVALTPSLRKAAAIQVASGLYGSVGFAPTRLNVADDPTRDVAVRQPALRSILEGASLESIQKLHSLQFSRVLAGWIRLVILLGFLPAKLHALPTSGLFVDPSFVLDFNCPAAGTNWIFAFLIFCGISLSLWIFAVLLPPVSLRSISLPQKPRKCFGKQCNHRSHCPRYCGFSLSLVMPWNLVVGRMRTS